jgi:hypothetical protein
MHQFHKFILSWNFTCFGQFICPSSGVYSLYTQQWYMSYRFVESFWAGPGWNSVPSWSCSKAVYRPVYDRQISSRTRIEQSSILVLLKSSLQTCMTYTIAECTVSKLLMIDRRTVWNVEFHDKINLWNWCIWLVLLQRNLLQYPVTWMLNSGLVFVCSIPNNNSFCNQHRELYLKYLPTCMHWDQHSNYTHMVFSMACCTNLPTHSPLW